MAREFNITEKDDFFIGDDKTIEIDLYDEEDQPLTVPGGWTFEWVLRRGRSAAAAVLSKPNASITVISTDNGPDTGVRIIVLAADTTDMEPDTYFHTLRRVDFGSKTTLSYGTAVLQWSAAR